MNSSLSIDLICKEALSLLNNELISRNIRVLKTPDEALSKRENYWVEFPCDAHLLNTMLFDAFSNTLLKPMILKLVSYIEPLGTIRFTKLPPYKSEISASKAIRNGASLRTFMMHNSIGDCFRLRLETLIEFNPNARKSQ